MAKFNKTFTSLTKVISAILLLCLFACNKSETEADEKTQNQSRERETSSVSIGKGKYLVDTNIIRQNFNKQLLLTILKTEKLSDKKSVEEIPDILKSFLDSISDDGDFDIANPNDDWQVASITDFSNALVLSANLKKMPTKQMIYFGLGKNIALLSYRIGGMRMSQEMAIIKFDDKKVVDFWFMTNAPFLTKKIDIMKYLDQKRDNGDGC